MFSAMFTPIARGETTADAVWHNKIPAALSEPAADIDKNPNLLHKYADNAGTKIHYVTVGSDKNPLMVFVHGFPDFWYSWRNQMQVFSADYQVVALDLRGYDLSDRPDGVENYKTPALLNDIRAVIDAERKGRKVILIGHDWGAALSWLFTGQNPDLIERLVVLSVPHPGAITKELLPWNHPVAQSRQRRQFDCGRFGLLGRQPRGQKPLHRGLLEIVHPGHDELLQGQLHSLPVCAQSLRSHDEDDLRRHDQLPRPASARNRGEPCFAEHARSGKILDEKSARSHDQDRSWRWPLHSA